MTERLTVNELRKLMADARELSIEDGAFVILAVKLMEEYEYRANVIMNLLKRLEIDK